MGSSDSRLAFGLLSLGCLFNRIRSSFQKHAKHGSDLFRPIFQSTEMNCLLALLDLHFNDEDQLLVLKGTLYTLKKFYNDTTNRSWTTKEHGCEPIARE
jgi:hypothetical protein